MGFGRLNKIEQVLIFLACLVYMVQELYKESCTSFIKYIAIGIMILALVSAVIYAP